MMKSGTLLEQIYYGEFCPGEHAQSRDPEYLSVCKRIDQGVRFFTDQLNEEHRKRFDQLIRAMQELSGMDAYANFACGFRAGAELMREISVCDERTRPFGG